MDPQVKKLITTGVLLLLFLILGAIYFFAPKEKEAVSPVATSTVSTAPTAPQDPLLTFQIKDAQTITFIWKYLPAGTECVNVYRAPKGTQNWLLWKKMCLGDQSLTSGEVDILLGKGERARDYDYYGEAVGSDDVPIWRSPGTAPTLPPAPPPQSSSTVNPPANTNPPASNPTPTSSQTSTTPTNPTPTTTPPTATPPPPAPLCPPNIPCYYTPQLTLSGTSTPSTATFWVQHLNDDIELGWQNLPTNTTRVVALRSVSETGPWTELLRQASPVKTSYYYIRFADDTLYQNRYYKIDLYEGTTKAATYGPLLLIGFALP